jgi:hypothetical protein
MKVIAFAGPSLPRSRRAEFRGVEWKPPVEAGDLLKLPPGSATTLCLIDGYFDHRPAVRHKEILLLLSRGTVIFGASSIGALRAAEMHPFGMIGIGEIFRAYARGTIVGDDEVALIHGAAEHDWRSFSVPLVDVRATLVRARRTGIIGAMEARRLLRSAAAIHYVERDWTAILAAGADPERRLGLAEWLRTHEVAQKRLDAEACVGAALAGIRPAPASPALVRTAFLDVLARECSVDLDVARVPLIVPAR